VLEGQLAVLADPSPTGALPFELSQEEVLDTLFEHAKHYSKEHLKTQYNALGISQRVPEEPEPFDLSFEVFREQEESKPFKI
jgi:hypothetical protein